jgi:hypothetical protein
MSPATPVANDTAEAYADSALAFIASELPGIDALSVMLNQRTHTDGTLYDCMDVGWRIMPDLVSTFVEAAEGADNALSQLSATTTTYYSHPDATKDWQQIVLHEIVVKASKVLSIYGGLGAVHKLPDPNVPTAILRGDPTHIAAGDVVLLTWETTNAVEVTLEPGPGQVALTGLTEVSPEVTTTYTLTATGWTTTVVDTVLVTVSGA